MRASNYDVLRQRHVCFVRNFVMSRLPVSRNLRVTCHVLSLFILLHFSWEINNRETSTALSIHLVLKLQFFVPIIYVTFIVGEKPTGFTPIL